MATDQAPSDVSEVDTYEQFEDRVRRISNVGNAAGILRWDQEVVMPDEGTPARATALDDVLDQSRTPDRRRDR